MLKMMRHHAKYFYVLFFIVILSFLFWGVGSVDKTSSGGIVAEVGKQKITQEEYYRAYDNAFKFYKDLYKEKFDEDMQKKLKLKDTVLDSLIGNRVLLLAAAENGIKVSDEELNDAIINEPVFMKNGVFDNQIYQNTLRLSRITPEVYESMKRQELTITRMTRLIEFAANPPVIDLGSASADEQTFKALKDAMLNDAKDKAVKAYINGYKKSLKIKEYRQLIS
jgi:parvulin-like peptidyl-prolyl isomerase